MVLAIRQRLGWPVSGLESGHTVTLKEEREIDFASSDSYFSSHDKAG
ncbi:hypothetical protein [Microbulbifer pacificus]|nr:hypothetical protein [Microbulbifer pacificus]